MSADIESRTDGAKFPASALGRPIIEAYLHARYRVLPAVGEPWVLRLGRPDTHLRDAQRSAHSTCSALVTACNPLGQYLTPSLNAARQKRLQSVLRARRCRYLHAAGEDPHCAWPAEPSILIFGLNRSTAVALGRRFGQNAILWSGVNGRVGLVLLR